MKIMSTKILLRLKIQKIRKAGTQKEIHQIGYHLVMEFQLRRLSSRVCLIMETEDLLINLSKIPSVHLSSQVQMSRSKKVPIRSV